MTDLLPHISQPLVNVDDTSSYEMRGWMEDVARFISLNASAGSKLKLISVKADLPDADATGVIYLEDELTYFFLSIVDLAGDRLVGGVNTVIIGASSENCRIKSTGLALGTALITSNYSLPMRNITLEAATILNLDATGNPLQALDWWGVNLQGSSDIGLIKNYSNFVASSMGFLGVSGLVFDGLFGTIAISDTILSGTNPGTIISIPATLTVARRFRINYSSIIVEGAGVGIDVDVSASIPVEGYIFDTCNFSGGGVYVQGVDFDDNKSRWVESRGITNSASLTGYFMANNATVTTISTSSTPVKVLGTTTPISVTQRFNNSTSNRSEYEGAITRDFRVTAVASLTCGNNRQIGVYVAKNGVALTESVSNVTTNAGGRSESASIQAVVELVETDYVEIFVENNTDTVNVTVTDLNVIVEALN